MGGIKEVKIVEAVKGFDEFGKVHVGTVENTVTDFTCICGVIFEC